MPAACALPPPGRLAPAVLGEMVAPLANMAEAALAAGPPATAGVNGGDPGRAEGDPRPARARGLPILVGQPTLRHAVKLGVLAALEQRITVRYQMKGMTPDETAGYIRHDLEQAGRTTELFTDDVIAQIHQAARGKPRTVNNIAIAALIVTAGTGKNLVDHASARAAIAEVTATD